MTKPTFYFLQQAYEHYETLEEDEIRPVLTRNVIHRGREGVKDCLMGDYFDEPLVKLSSIMAETIRVAGANNDINVLENSPSFDDLLDDKAPVAMFVIIMANLPPPNNDPNVPEDEHAPAPEHAPIAPNPAPIQPNDSLADDDEDPEEEEEPIPEQAPAAPARFAPQWIGWYDPNNNNGWLIKDDDDEEEIEAEDDEEVWDKD
ncbi:ALP1-like protein [Tanacetum coccineum]